MVEAAYRSWNPLRGLITAMGNELSASTSVSQSLGPLMGYSNLSLDEILDALCAAGKPRVARMDHGWLCSIDMHVAAAGTEFKIRSEFDCETPLAAARQCAERVIQTLRQWCQL
jgi:hypothetical protein